MKDPHKLLVAFVGLIFKPDVVSWFSCRMPVFVDLPVSVVISSLCAVVPGFGLISSVSAVVPRL